MIATEANVIAFQQASNVGLVAYSECSGYYGQLRKAFATTYLRDNPKHGLAILREMLAQTERAIAATRDFQAHVLGLMADIEAALPPEPEPENATP